jgi:hypothetical protein
MSTDLAMRKSPSKSEAHLQRKLAELCARIKRVDVVTHLLVLAITIFTYALFVGCFDWVAGSSTATAVQATRWVAYVAFLLGSGFLAVQTIRCCLRRVSPYYVAHQIEQSVPGAKNSLINWLDLHDQGLPPAFQKNLSTVAAEQLEESDTEQTVPKRRNRILLGMLGAPTLGLLLLLLLGPSALLSSMLRAFLPFYTPAPAARTQITLLTPEGGDAEVGPAQTVIFSVKIEGRVPTGKTKPALQYRRNADDDFLSLPLQPDGAGIWSTQLLPTQLGAGVAYKISAGDAETPVYQVRTRAAAHVRKFEIKYEHRPFRRRNDTTSVFPDDTGTSPIIHGPIGSDVELTIHASRIVKTASVEITTRSGKKELPIRMSQDDPGAFTCRFMLDQPGEFRVAFTTPDGENNVDRDTYPILVAEDDAPKVVLTQPGADVALTENGTLMLAGSAVSSFGIKSLTLHLRIIDGPDQSIALLPQPFRPGVSFQLADGSYPLEIGYMDIVDLDQFKNEKGTIRLLRPGNIIEYWLEAIDSAEFPNAGGNIGRSVRYKITLLPRTQDATREQAKRDDAIKQQKNFQKKQDQDLAKKKDDPKGGNSGSANSQKSLDQIQKEQSNANKKLSDAKKEQQQNQGRGESKGAEQKNSEKKDSPQNPGDTPQAKPAPTSPSDDAGDSKDQGKGQGASGESRDDGLPQKKKADGPKDGSPQGTAKGVEQNGPDLPNKDQQTAANPMPPPNGQAKSGKMNEPGNSGESKQGPDDQANAGQPRGDEPPPAPKELSWDDIAKHIQNLPREDQASAEAGKTLAQIGKSADDPRMRDIAKEALAKNGRDPKTGEKEKLPNPYANKPGISQGVGDDIKAAAANREFAARIGQMQLDDWKKRLNPDLLKKAGMTEADWLRYVKNQEAYDTLVRQLNADAAKKALKELSKVKSSGTAIRSIESQPGNASLRGSNAPPPLELMDAFKRQAERESDAIKRAP